jgi:hypothetical protein
MRHIRHTAMLATLTITLIALAACASRYYLLVDYHLPTATEQLKGQQLALRVKDDRTDPAVLTTAAARSFGVFRNHYNLTIVSGKERTPIGARDLQGLFQDAFEKRLTHAGVQVLPGHQPGAPLIQITINSVEIDLENRKWIARVVYHADLFVNDRRVTRETVSGRAERPRLVGSDNIDETMSDIVTESINRLDIVKLLQQGDLI